MNMYKIQSYELSKYIVAPTLDIALKRWNIYIKDTYALGTHMTTGVEELAHDVLIQDVDL